MVGALKNLSAGERERVNAAIAEAQTRSRARFAFVAVPASDHYHLYPVVWGATLALVAFGALALGLPHLNIRYAFAAVIAVFLVASLVLEWWPLRVLAVPRRAKQAHAHALAHREFAVRILSHPERGVLFFVSLAERYTEIVADHALHQAAGQAAWDGIVAQFTAEAARGKLAEGLVAAIQACGALLERHQPKE